jgi:DNA-directed RNA polymerase I and III subunit RPAC2
MDYTPANLSSAAAYKDPDRHIIEDFERGDPSLPNISTMATEATGTEADDPFNVTFVIRHEDHTIGNALRWVIARYQDVDFVGYTLPHPSEIKIHLRIQCKGPRTARQVLKDALQELESIYAQVQETFVQALQSEGFKLQEQ